MLLLGIFFLPFLPIRYYIPSVIFSPQSSFEWEQKGTHEQHLSVIDYKKQERSKELAAVEEKLAEQKVELEAMTEHIGNLTPVVHEYDDMERKLTYDPEYRLPEPPALMSAKNYKTKVADPLVNRLKTIVKNLLVRFFTVMNSHNRLERENRDLRQDQEYLKEDCDSLAKENKSLKEQTRDYALLRKVFGNQQIDEMISLAKEKQQAEKRRHKNHEHER